MKDPLREAIDEVKNWNGESVSDLRSSLILLGVQSQRVGVDPSLLLRSHDIKNACLPPEGLTEDCWAWDRERILLKGEGWEWDIVNRRWLAQRRVVEAWGGSVPVSSGGMKTVSVRMAVDLYERLKREAKKKEKTFSALVVDTLSAKFKK